MKALYKKITWKKQAHHVNVSLESYNKMEVLDSFALATLLVH